jgi:hypothetical protein
MQKLYFEGKELVNDDDDLPQFKYGNIITAKLKRETISPGLKLSKPRTGIPVTNLKDANKGVMVQLATVVYEGCNLYDHKKGDPNNFAPCIEVTVTPFYGTQENSTQPRLELKVTVMIGVEEQHISQNEMRRGFFVETATVLTNYEGGIWGGEVVDSRVDDVVQIQRAQGNEMSTNLQHWHQSSIVEKHHFNGWIFVRGTWDNFEREEYSIKHPEKSLKNTNKRMGGRLKKVIPEVSTQLHEKLHFAWNQVDGINKSNDEIKVKFKIEIKLRDIQVNQLKVGSGARLSKSFGSYSRTIEFEDNITVAKFGNDEDSKCDESASQALQSIATTMSASHLLS